MWGGEIDEQTKLTRQAKTALLQAASWAEEPARKIEE